MARRRCAESLSACCAAWPLAQRRLQLLLPEAEETLLVRAHLNEAEVVVARVGPLLDRFDIGLDVRAVRHGFGHVLWTNGLGRGLEVDRVRQLGHHLPPLSREAEALMCEPQPLVLVVVDAEGELADARLAVELLGERAVGLDSDHAVRALERELDRAISADGEVQ